MIHPADTMRILSKLSACFPHAKIPPASLQAYAEILCDIPTADLSRAAQDHVATSKFFPSIAELREAALQHNGNAPREPLEAWDEVTSAIGRLGRHRQPVFDDPAIEATVRSMGWGKLCDSTNQISDRAQFKDLYLHNAAREKTKATARSLGEARAQLTGAKAVQIEAGAGAPRSE